MRWLVGALVLVGVGWSASACSSSVFACTSQEQCQAGSVAGQCQDNGYCSFPDESCPTGQRFGDAAPGDVANACVAADDGTGTTDLGQASTGGVEPPDPDGMLDGSSSSTTSTTSPTSMTSTTLPVDETTTDPDLTTGMGSGMTTGVVEECPVPFEDAFDGRELSPAWTTFMPMAISLGLNGAELGFTVEASPEWVVASAVTNVGSLAGGWARVLVSELDQPDLELTAGLVVANDSCQLQLFITPAGLFASLWNGETQMTTPLGEDGFELPAWLQIRQDDDGTAHFEWSMDEVSWREVAMGSFPECGDLSNGVEVGMNVGGQLVDQQQGLRAFDHFESCSQL